MLERLQKIIARAGIASRRHAEELIRSGQVLVNGVVVTELGSKADPDHDRIEAAGRAVEQPGAASYYILHKPAHVVSTMSDPEGRATLRHVLRGLSGGIFPVGRLDYAASGLILLTSDGKLADTIFKASPNLVKVYWMKVKGRPTPETLSKVGHQARARLRLLRAPGASAGHVDNPWYEAELRAPRRDLLRQALFAAGHPVEKIKRVRLGPLDLGDLPEGQYRQLAPSEVEALRRAVEQAAKGVEQAAPAPAPPAGARPFQRKQWRSSAGPRPAPPLRPGRDGDGHAPGPRPPGDRFAPAQTGKPAWTGRPAAAGAPPHPHPRGERGTKFAGERGTKFGPRGERGAEFVKRGPGFGSKPGKGFDGKPGKRFDDKRGAGFGGKPRPQFGSKPGKSFGDKPGRKFDGERSKSFGSKPGDASGERRFPPRRDRSGSGGFKPAPGGFSRGPKPGDKRGGFRGRPGQGGPRPGGGFKRRDPASPGGPPRRGASGPGKFHGKPGRPGGPRRGDSARPGAPGGPHRPSGRPGGRSFNRPGPRPPRPPKPRFEAPSEESE